MKDEELLARKKRLSAILLHRLNRHFYLLACRSFSLDALSIDQAFAGIAAGLSARDRSMVVRMYVHFRLALAEMFLETEAEGSSFLSLTLAGKLSLDVTGKFSEAFPKIRDGLSYFFSSTGKPEAGILPLVSLLSLETGLSLSPYVDFFRKMKIEPQESYFVDDSPANIEAGIRLGMRGCVYHQDMPELRRNLREAGIDLKDA